MADAPTVPILYPCWSCDGEGTRWDSSTAAWAGEGDTTPDAPPVCRVCTGLGVLTSGPPRGEDRTVPVPGGGQARLWIVGEDEDDRAVIVERVMDHGYTRLDPGVAIDLGSAAVDMDLPDLPAQEAVMAYLPGDGDTWAGWWTPANEGDPYALQVWIVSW